MSRKERPKSFRTPLRLCPKCRAHSAYATISPAEGHFTICINCASVLRFKADLTLRAVSANELGVLADTNPEQLRLVRRAQVVVFSAILQEPRTDEPRTGRA